ncbi:hypothetical protein BGX23_010538 [Mortierella sp. AD031]|nr:hypothetical protein BGX23_010538 [Mortierella sp. AD031]KAG0215963.1 hypothetical protein BGX33_000661 [Mortierella sp. NVP41]
MIDPNSLKVTELKAELTARGLSTKGVKKELVTRLEEALATDGAITGSATEPDVALKDTAMDHSTNDNSDNESDDASNTTPPPGTTSSSTEKEAREIAQIAPPVAEPVADDAEADVVMAPAPVPVAASVTEATAPIEGVQAIIAATITPDPVEGTRPLAQEGLIDTTMTDAPSTESKKRSLDSEGPAGTSSSNGGDGNGNSPSGEAKEAPAKRHKAIAINRDGNEKIIAAAKETLEADARRRSAAPSPSPAPTTGRTASTNSNNNVSTVAEITTPPPATTDSGTPTTTISTGSPTGPKSPTEDKRVGGSGAGVERRDARSLMHRQIQLAALDRKPDGANKASTVSPTAVTAPVDLPEAAPAEASTADATKRALTITNFVRPLNIPQVKRMLSQSGEIETLWMDSIRTHCYVIFKEAAAAKKAYNQTNNVVFPPETGKALKPHFITAEAASRSIAAAEEAQKAGKKPVIFTGNEPAEKSKAAAPKPKAPIVIRGDEVEAIFKREQVQVVQPNELFNLTKAQPALYYKAVKEPPAPKESAAAQVAEAN